MLNSACAAVLPIDTKHVQQGTNVQHGSDIQRGTDIQTGTDEQEALPQYEFADDLERTKLPSNHNKLSTSDTLGKFNQLLM